MSTASATPTSAHSSSSDSPFVITPPPHHVLPLAITPPPHQLLPSRTFTTAPLRPGNDPWEAGRLPGRPSLGLLRRTGQQIAGVLRPENVTLPSNSPPLPFGGLLPRPPPRTPYQTLMMGHVRDSPPRPPRNHRNTRAYGGPMHEPHHLTYNRNHPCLPEAISVHRMADAPAPSAAVSARITGHSSQRRWQPYRYPDNRSRHHLSRTDSAVYQSVPNPPPHTHPYASSLQCREPIWTPTYRQPPTGSHIPPRPHPLPSTAMDAHFRGYKYGSSGYAPMHASRISHGSSRARQYHGNPTQHAPYLHHYRFPPCRDQDPALCTDTEQSISSRYDLSGQVPLPGSLMDIITEREGGSSARRR